MDDNQVSDTGSKARRTSDPTAIVVKGYPRLSETFIAQELLELQRLGLTFCIVSLRYPTDRKRHSLHDRIDVPVIYLPEYLYQEPGRVLAAWRQVRRLPGYAVARSAWLADLKRDPSLNRGRRFGQALVLAAERPGAFSRIYAHFLHTPASVARYAALMLGLPWSVSAHAKDIWTTPDWEKREKLAEADWAVTCTRSGWEHLDALAPGKVDLVYHGLDLSRFPAPPAPRPARDGSDPADPIRLVSVGRAVAKKGFDDLLRALAVLPKDLAWRWTHVGGGKDLSSLKALSNSLGLKHLVEWQGALDQGEVVEVLRASDLFVLASRVADDGDRDGLPNVLMEAASQELCCLSTKVSAIPEFITDALNGRLVEPGQAAELASAIEDLTRNPAQRLALGGQAREDLVARFSHVHGMRILQGHFGLESNAGPTADGERDAAA